MSFYNNGMKWPCSAWVTLCGFCYWICNERNGVWK